MRCILNVGTVPTGCILTVGTVPPGCILTVGTVPTDNLSLFLNLSKIGPFFKIFGPYLIHILNTCQILRKCVWGPKNPQKMLFFS